MACYSIEISDDEDGFEKLHALIDFIHEERVKEEKLFAQERGISHACASDVLYLRTRSRWSHELEEELIRLHKEGTPPNIFDFGC